jgi:uncharacterized protein YndB with AHSA1/START domain
VAATLASPAAAEEKEPLPAGDVVAKRTIDASADAVYRRLLDLKMHQKMWPEGCTQKWDFGTTSVGVGASARLTYRAAMMRRRLTATVASGDPGRYLKIDHAGKKGFAITWTLEAVNDQTRVEVHTWVDPPPWPLTKTYMNKIRPAWKECHNGLLDNLARALADSGA